MGPICAREHGADPPVLQRLLWRFLSASKIRSDRHSGRFRRRDGKLGRHHVLRIGASIRSEEIVRGDAPTHLRSDRARNGAPMVRRSRDHGLVGQSLVERGIRLLDGQQMYRAFQSRLGSLAGQKYSARPTRRTGIAKEVAMEGDARSTTHAIQQPVANESDANSAFDDITYRKGQSFLRMLESFLGEDVFRDGVRRYIAAHQYSNSTTADLWNALSDASGKPVGEIAAAWTEQPGFPVVMMKRDGEKVSLSQERFTINFPNAPALQWKIPLTWFVVSENKIESRLMNDKIEKLPAIAADRVIKLNANGAGNYRVQYDDSSWNALLGALAKLNLEDRVNLLSDSWALVQANRADVSLYLELIGKLPRGHELAERDQIVNAFDYINRLLTGESARDKFQAYARSTLRPTFNELGWEPKKNESPHDSLLRASLIVALGDLNDQEIIDGCKQHFEKFVADPGSLAPDLRASIFFVVGQNADEATWNKLHELGLKTTSIEEKQNYYDALAAARDPNLAGKALQISLSDELPTSRALHVAGKVARYSGHPDLAWEFAKANMKALLEKTDALGANTFAPDLFVFFSEKSRADELKTYAKSNLPATSAKEVAKAVDEVEFRAEFKKRIVPQLNNWLDSQAKHK